MKSALFLLFLLIPFSGFSQDVIITNDSTRIQAKVIEISPTEVRYKDADNLEGPTIVLQRTRIYKITYPNGKGSILTEGKKAAASNPEADYVPSRTAPSGTHTQVQNAVKPALTPTEMYNAGTLEAIQYYKGNGPMWVTAASTLGFGVVGIITGGIMAAIPPNIDNQRVSDMALLKDPSFRKAYRKQAHRRKVGKIATGFGMGLVGLIIYVGATSN